ncbi:UDP-N-acetylmuramoyl-tripeptide--D-alanyl-D-alanine ligase [Pseudoclavibacter albus]|uniref:UDP-N-acetylmuramoyl-tripeptide--D-alanyl-D- alanine ligase n=1 Tax=Pseudoclavibacter albus TaxID=272241 RepID=UPI000825DF5C|nr:UDP-N-acetylmuramoyl-tripeptide--D-alanyl-D-alanine ligase [Pseudoclavibacter alba]
MIDLSLTEIATAVSGRLVLGGSDTAETIVNGYVDTDSREITPGDIFVAKPGEVTDGHLYAPKAVQAGAVLCIVERELELSVSQIVVENSVVALGDLAREVITRVKALGKLTEIAVTGSNGKTTTKNLLREIFSARGETVAPIASFNNEVGAPITFCRATENTDTLIAEMGASAPGEIRRLIKMAKPDVGIVLTVGLAHAGEFGGIETTLRSKTEMVEDLGPEDWAVLNRDDARVASMADKTKAQILWFGRGDDADVRASDVETSIDGTSFTMHLPGQEPVRVQFAVIGEHHVVNALAAAAASHTQGVPATEIRDALERVTRAERWRMEVLTRTPLTIINDAYNASPDSMAAALRTLAQIAAPEQRTVAVLGAMSELGEYSVEEHDRLGLLAVRLNISQIVVVGREARALHLGAIAQGSWDGESVFVEDQDEAFEFLTKYLGEGDLVLVKSSNSAGLRHLGDRLAEHYA